MLLWTRKELLSRHVVVAARCEPSSRLDRLERPRTGDLTLRGQRERRSLSLTLSFLPFMTSYHRVVATNDTTVSWRDESSSSHLEHPRAVLGVPVAALHAVRVARLAPLELLVDPEEGDVTVTLRSEGGRS